MKAIKMLVVLAVIVSSVPLFARQADANVQQGNSATVNGNSVNQSAGATARVNRRKAGMDGYGAADMRPVQGELERKVDAKTAQPGDPVVLKTTERARTAEGIDITRGSRIFGHVTEVQAHSKSNGESRLGLEFDRLELKDGRSVPIHSVIESIEPPASAMAAANATESDGFFEPAPMGGARTSGGLTGGGGSGLVGGAGSLAGGSMHAADSLGAAGGAKGALSQNRLSSGLNGSGALNGAINATGNVKGSPAQRPTGIPGLTLGGDASGMASGTLSAPRTNVHLDSGTQMVLGITSGVSR